MPAIEAHSLGKSYAGRRALWDLSFSVERGEVFGLLGPNGAGKTTTLRILAGLISPDAGVAHVAGHEIRPGAPSNAALRGSIGLLTEQPGFYDRLSARENLVVFGKLQGLTAHEADRRATNLLARFLLAAHADRPFAVLSRGMKQKLAIARALLHEPAVILLDEPTVGLDPEATREVRALVGELAAEKRTIVLCTHHLDEVERLCARAAFVAGRLLAVHEVKALATGTHRLRIGLASSAESALKTLRALPFVLDAHAEMASSAALRAAATSATVEVSDAVAGDALSANDLRANALHSNDLLVELANVSSVPDALAALVESGARLVSAVPVRHPLEEAYLALLAQARDEGLIS